jgi:hypothetical protein
MADEYIDVNGLPLGLESSPMSTGNSFNVRVGMKIDEAERRLILATLEYWAATRKEPPKPWGSVLRPYTTG